jgi:hypothetical protein
MEKMMNELELTVIGNEYDRRLRIQFGDIIEIEQPDGAWYSILPAYPIVDTFARFFQRLIWKRDGVTPDDLPRDAETDLTREGLISEEAENLAVSFLEKVCRKIDASLEFHLLAESYLEDWIDFCFQKAPSAVAQ